MTASPSDVTADAVVGVVAVVDGRAARSRRTRAAIVDAFVALLADGDLRPTAARIAERAGISVRALWTHFGELDELAAAAAAEVLARQDASFTPVDPLLPLGPRVAAFCRQRARLLESVGPYARASQLQEAFSPQLRAYHRLHVERVVAECRTLFADVLRQRSTAETEALLAALAATCTWGAWATLRDDLGLSPARARSVLQRSVTALLAPP